LPWQTQPLITRYRAPDPSSFPKFKWVVKPNLLPAGKETQGHFRRVNCKVWAAYCEMYKGCGPAIKYVRANFVQFARIHADQAGA
jgi:hypothetical protein